MTARNQAIMMINLVPDAEIPSLLEVISRFIPTDIDDIATPDDIAACEQGMKEYERGETIPHEAIDWD